MASDAVERIVEGARRTAPLADLARRLDWPIVEVDGQFYRVNPELLRFGSQRNTIRLEESCL